MFDFRQFLFRSPERDGETDRRRLALLEQMDDGVAEVARRVELANVERRLVGAERRLARLRIQLTILRTIENTVVTRSSRW
jgi:hypothetical protein